MLESDGNWVVGSGYVRYSQRISVRVKYSLTLYFIHSNTHLIFSHFSISEIRIHLNN